MSDFITRTARLVPYAKRPKQVPSYVTAYSYEPLPDEPGAHLGSLFVVMEVLVSGRSSEEVADLIIETMGEHYYNRNQDNAEPLHRFENAIKATNHELTGYVNQGNAAWIGKLSAIAAVQVGNEIHITQTGSAEAFLYRGKSTTQITANRSNARPTAPSKTFGSIASGQLEVTDRLLLATPALIHHLSLKKLHEIIANTSPNNAIAEITELLRGGTSERIAALIIEITTPELAALQIRSEQPSEIHLGTPETALEAAKLAAAPIAQATMTSSKQLGGIAKTSWERGKPHLHRGAHSIVQLLRWILAGPGARKRVAIGLAIIILAGGIFWQLYATQSRTKQLLTRYQTDYQQYQLAEQAASSGDKTSARTLLTHLQPEVAELSSAPGHNDLNNTLKHSALPEGMPNSLPALSSLISTKLDELEGLHKVAATTITSFNTIKNAAPKHFELSAGKAYVIDSQNNSSIYIVNMTTNSSKTTTADTSKLGNVVATTLSASGDGIYLLTSKPSVWFYRFDNDSLAEQTISLGQWPTAKAIASYAGNLYLLGDGIIYKHVKTFSGFSPKTEYLSSAGSSQLTGATTLAIDGSVYIMSPNGLSEYLSGAFKQTATIPSSLSSAKNLRSTANGTTLIALSSTGQRVGLWDASHELTFSKQYQLNGVKTIFDATYDDKTKTFYALADDRLVRFTP